MSSPGWPARSLLTGALLLLLASAIAQRPTMSQKPAVDSLRFLALGDSYTIGEGVDSAGRWPVQLARFARDRGIPLSDPEIVARTGWTTDELADGIDRANPPGPYSLVSLAVGVNNQYRGRPVEEYRTQFADLLDRAVLLAGGDPHRVLVLSIPDWGVTPFAEGRDRLAIAQEIDALNRVNRQESHKVGVHWIDVTGVSRESAGAPDLVAPDGLHPSVEMYRRWAERALPAVVRVFRPPGEPMGGED